MRASRRHERIFVAVITTLTLLFALLLINILGLSHVPTNDRPAVPEQTYR